MPLTSASPFLDCSVFAQVMVTLFPIQADQDPLLAIVSLKSRQYHVEYHDYFDPMFEVEMLDETQKVH